MVTRGRVLIWPYLEAKRWNLKLTAVVANDQWAAAELLPARSSSSKCSGSFVCGSGLNFFNTTSPMTHYHSLWLKKIWLFEYITSKHSTCRKPTGRDWRRGYPCLRFHLQPCQTIICPPDYERHTISKEYSFNFNKTLWLQIRQTTQISKCWSVTIIKSFTYTFCHLFVDCR